MTLIVIHNETLDARSVIDHEALPEFALRGWELVGPAVGVRDPRTLDEADAEVAAAAALAASLAAQTSVPEAAEPTTPTEEADEADADTATTKE